MDLAGVGNKEVQQRQHTTKTQRAEVSHPGRYQEQRRDSLDRQGDEIHYQRGVQQRHPESGRSAETGKDLQVAVAREQQRSQAAVVVSVGEPDYAVFGPELRMED